MSFAASVASRPTDIAVPTPGIVPAIPDAASNIAPLKSPDINRCPANNSPAPRPTNGIFFNSPLPSAFAPTFAIALPPTFAATFLAPFFSNAFPALLAPLTNFVPDLATLPALFIPFLPTARTFLIFFPTLVFFRNFNLLPNLRFLSLLSLCKNLSGLFDPFVGSCFAFFSSLGDMGAAPAIFCPPHHFRVDCNPIFLAGFAVSDIPNIAFNFCASAMTPPLAGDAGNCFKNPIEELMRTDAPSLYISSTASP